MKLTLCGSIAFYAEMEAAKEALLALGHDVKLPLLSKELPPEIGGGRTMYFGKYIEENGGIDGFSPDHMVWDLKEGGIRDHFDKIEWGEAIVVVNPEKRGIPGYIGGNTLMEIGLAFYLRKPIYILNPVSSELSHKQEVLGMKPVFLDGDINKISG